jgi:hypothetical protein
MVDISQKPPYPPKPTKAKSGGKVTAIAGFRYSSGVVLCADSELNYGTVVKTHINKISVFGDTSQGVRGALTGSGDWDDVQRVVQDIQKHWIEILDGQVTFDEVVGKKVEELYEQSSQDPNWTLAVIAVVWTAGGKACVIKADDRKGVKMVSDFACDGMGAAFGHYLAGSLHFPNMAKYYGICLASYILYMADAYAPFCGGLGNIFTLDDDGSPFMELEWDMEAQREFFKRFTYAIRPILLEGPSSDVPPDAFDNTVEEFVAQLRKLRKDVELDMYEKAKKYGHLD